METLKDYLTNLRSNESTWALYINPDNIDQFRIGQTLFENGGRNDGFLYVGTLDSLCPYPSEYDCFSDLFIGKKGELWSPYPKAPNSKYDVNSLWDLYISEELDPDFNAFLEEQLQISIDAEIEFNVSAILEEIDRNLEDWVAEKKELALYAEG